MKAADAPSRDIRDRYQQADGEVLYIDVTAQGLRDLYQDYDRQSPYAKRDLDPDVVEYLVDGAEDAGNRTVILRFHLNEAPGEEGEQRLSKSVETYFLYEDRLEKIERRKILRTNLILFSVGLAVLAGAVLLRQPSEEDLPLMNQFLVQGLLVAAWMSIWEGMSNFILEWPGHLRMSRIYRKLAAAPVEFTAARADAGN